MLFFILMSIFVLGIIVSTLFRTDAFENTVSGFVLLVMVVSLSLAMAKYFELSIKVVN